MRSERNSTGIHKIVLAVLVLASLLSVLPFLVHATVRLGGSHPVQHAYNEGWNVYHTARLLQGQQLYTPVTALPLIPVNYPPLSFAIVAPLSLLAGGSVLMAGRAVMFFSFLAVAGLVFAIVHALTARKLAALFGALLWVVLMVQHARAYIGAYDPQMLAHAFSLLAMYLYVRWMDGLTARRIVTIALLCSVALFIKHLAIAVPLALGIAFLSQNRRAFLTFAAAGFASCLLLFAGTWLYSAGEFLSNFLDTDRRLVEGRWATEVIHLFVFRYVGVVFLPFLALLASRSSARTVFPVYLGISFLLGCYAINGVGVGNNAWFDLFISSALVSGLFAADPSVDIDRLRHWVRPLGACLVLAAIVCNDQVLGRFLSSDVSFEGSTLVRIRSLALILGAMGLALLFKNRIVRLVSLRQTVGAGILLCLALPISMPLDGDLEKILFNREWAKFKQWERAYEEDVKLLRRIPGPALFENILLGYDAGKELYFDPFNGTQLMVAGRIPENLLLEAIQRKQFKAIVLNYDVEAKVKELSARAANSSKPTASVTDRWTDNSLRAIKDTYYPMKLDHVSRHHFYLPRN